MYYLNRIETKNNKKYRNISFSQTLYKIKLLFLNFTLTQAAHIHTIMIIAYYLKIKGKINQGESFLGIS